MHTFSIILSVLCITATSFYGLMQIAERNTYTSVRQYAKPKPDTIPPTIEFVNHKDGDIVHTNTVNIQVAVQDDKTPSDRIVVEGDGRYDLKTGFNPIVVTATDDAGNTAGSFIIIEKQ